MPNPFTHSQRRAVQTYLAESEALFALLEHDRHAPLPDAIAHRGRAAVAGIQRLFVATGHAPGEHLSDSNPLMPTTLFIALSQATLALGDLLRTHRTPPRTANFPRRESE